MITRLLQSLDSPRRHLAILAGLLLTTFVLTGVLAWQAQQSARQQGASAQRMVEEVAHAAATQWAEQFSHFLDSSLPAFGNPAVRELAARADLPLKAFAATSDVKGLCEGCRRPAVASAYFSLDLGSGATEWLGSAGNSQMTDEVAAHVTAVRYGMYSAKIGIGLYVVDAPEAPAVLAYVRHDPSGRPIRVVGVVLESAVLHDMFRTALQKTRIYPSAAVHGLSNDSLIAARVYAGGTLLMSTGGTGGQFVAVHDAAAPLWGVQYHTNVRPAAAARYFRVNDTLKYAMLIMLMTVIALLTAGSMLLVRREAELVRLRADFIASASHELRTPLAQIRMFTETLLLGRVRSDIERRRSLEIVDQEARRLTHLVENLLQFSKTDGGRRIRLAPEPTLVADEMRAAMDSFSPMLRERGAELRAELQENVTASVDRHALRQVLINLIDNALKYGPRGQRITVGLALFDDAARVWVDDEGPGIPAAELERVFESFYRLGRDMDAKVTGSGIGLAVVRQLARLHEGNAWAESAPGGGARIVVEFPGAYLRQPTAGDLAAAS